MFKHSPLPTLVCLLVMLTAVALHPRGGETAPGAEPGTHFILLIDDSGDMRRGQRDVLGNVLPEFLFRGSVEGRAADPALPNFQPGRDRISLIYFTILKTAGGGCREGQRGMSVSPDEIFTFEGGEEVGSREALDAFLIDSLKRPCRNRGREGRGPGQYSPIATSPMLVLPYLQRRLEDGQLYSRTILIVASNERFNTAEDSPAYELSKFDTDDITDIEVARQVSHQVSRLFSFNTFPGWDITVRPDLFLVVSEVTPRPEPDLAVSLPQSVKVDRGAVSSDRLRVAPEVKGAGDLRIMTGGDGDAYRFLPLFMEMRFQDAQGGPWQVGQRTLEGPISVDLRNCQAPQCVTDGGSFTVSLFDSIGDGLTLSPADPLLNVGRLDISVGLRYQTGLYDHMFVKSSERHAEIVPTRADTLPGYLFLPDVTLDNRELAGQYERDDDGVTTQQDARSRILLRHSWYTLGLVFAVAAAIVLVVAHLFRTKYHRPFKPRLKWEPASEVVVDFNRPAASRLLVGALQVVNEGGLPWLGRLLKNEEQPTRRARLRLSYNFFSGSGLKLAEEHPLGFVRAGAGADARPDLSLDAEEAVSDGTHVYIFLAAEAIRDYLHPAPARAVPGKDFQIDLSVHMGWRAHEYSNGNSLAGRLKSLWVVDDHGELAEPIQCPLSVRPEEERKPFVTFEPREGRLEFRKGEGVLVGRFVFESRAGHTFARPFGGQYTIRVSRENVPLGEGVMRLETSDVEVAPDGRREVPVYLFCDGEAVANPDPVSDTYRFALAGDFEADSRPGPYYATLFRDPGRPEVELLLLFPKPEREIFWSKAGEVKQRLVLADGAVSGESEVENSTVVLCAHPVRFRAGGAGKQNLLTLRIGNSATAGRGEIAVGVRTAVWCPEAETDIVMAAGRRHDDLLGVYAHGESGLWPEVRVGAGGDPQVLDVRIDPALIEKIRSAVIPAEKFEARVTLDLSVTDDEGRDISRRTLNLVVPLRLEQLPGHNWLCIDFGTSAIAAALGTARVDGIRPIPLQDLKPEGGQSLAEYDRFNSERDDPYLLPSLVICDADRRTQTALISRPGFPGYYSPSLSLAPGEPDFIGLPATGTEISNHPERIIYSLKSWLAKAPGSIPLKPGIKYKENGRLVTRESLPIEKVVESGFAALAEGYLLVTPEYRADQIVLCHPNTFTERHVSLLRDIAHSALSQPHRFGIPRQERITLISESDAVAYYYCMEQMRNRPRGGSEQILVYDFGAGTLDLSLIRVTWEMEQFATPVGWDIEGRIGVPVAGNYLDELLARMVDDLLNDPQLPGREYLTYQYPIARKERHNPQASPKYREAILELWRAIRTAKHEWDGVSPLKIKVGSLLNNEYIIRLKTGEEYSAAGLTEKDSKISTDYSRKQLMSLPRADGEEVRLSLKGESIFLSTPAERVHRDGRVSAFVEFVTGAVIDELCGGAGVPAEQVEAVIVSGRGALWPGLRDKVWKRFHPDAARPDLVRDHAMKNAVVRGAIGRQVNVRLNRGGNESRWKPKLGILLNDDQDLFVEDDWEKQPLNLSRSETFRIVQINLRNPNPREDFRPGSLRRHFYIDLVNRKFERDELWDEDRELYIHKGRDAKNGELTLYIEDRQGNYQEPVIVHASAGETVTDLPWPIGPAYILEPDEAPAGGRAEPSGEQG